jgi:acyl-CoA thioesterase-1
MPSCGYRRLVLLVSLTLCCGCHSAPTTAPPNAAPTAQAEPSALSKSAIPAPDPRPLLLCFGDSLTAGYGADPGESFPDYLQSDLDAAGYRYRVVNEGVSGNTTKDALARLPHVLALHPQVVILELGGNDGLRGLPLAQTQQNLDTLLAALTRAHIRVVLGGITLPPNYGADYIHGFDRIYPALAARYHVPLLSFVLRNVSGVPGSMQDDGIHATAQGNQQIARNFLPLVTPLLQQPR